MFSRIVPVKLNIRKQAVQHPEYERSQSGHFQNVVRLFAEHQAKSTTLDLSAKHSSQVLERCLQCWVLWKHADRLAQLFQPEFRDVDAVDAYRSRL